MKPLSPAFLKRRARLGGIARAKRLSAKRRAQIARMGYIARRANEIAAEKLG